MQREGKDERSYTCCCSGRADMATRPGGVDEELEKQCSTHAIVIHQQSDEVVFELQTFIFSSYIP